MQLRNVSDCAQFEMHLCVDRACRHRVIFASQSVVGSQGLGGSCDFAVRISFCVRGDLYWFLITV
jgi:hypothetical protein